jgi:hypothetical protein
MDRTGEIKERGQKIRGSISVVEYVRLSVKP